MKNRENRPNIRDDREVTAIVAGAAAEAPQEPGVGGNHVVVPERNEHIPSTKDVLDPDRARPDPEDTGVIAGENKLVHLHPRLLHRHAKQPGNLPARIPIPPEAVQTDPKQFRLFNQNANHKSKQSHRKNLRLPWFHRFLLLLCLRNQPPSPCPRNHP